MNKKTIIIIVTILVLIILFILTSKGIDRTMQCTGNQYIIGGQSFSEYVFKGTDKIVKSQEVEENIFSSDVELISQYIEIISKNEGCRILDKKADYVSYSCAYDLEEYDLYKELKDSNNNLTFDSIKEKFEEDNFVCSFK